jgi:hypothetical protein
MRPDFRNYNGIGLQMLAHSAKGTTWKDHKYIKRIDGTYYYPDSYEGGRHLDNDSSEEVENESSFTLSSDEITALANEVIQGNFGNGDERKEALGEHYQEIQNRVNELLSQSSGSTKLSSASSETVSSGTEAVEEAVTKISSSSSTKKGLDMETVYSVYRKSNKSSTGKTGKNRVSKT